MHKPRRPFVRVLALGAGVATLFAGCSSSAKHTTSPVVTSPPTAAATTTTTMPIAPVVRTGQQQLYLLYDQGVARIPGGWIFSGTNWLYKTDDKLKEITHLSPAIPAAWKAKGFNHIGDIDVAGKYVYAPLEEPDYKKGHQATARYDVATLRFVDAVMLPQHQNSFVTIDPETMIAYTADQFDGNTLLRYDVTHGWKPLPALRMSQVLHHTQGADIFRGAIWISTDDPVKGVYGVNLKTGQVTPVARLGHAGGEGEGIDATELPSGFLHVLTVDPKFSPVWFEHFRA